MSKQKTDINCIKLKNEKQVEQNIISSNKIVELENKLIASDDKVKLLSNEKN